MNRNEVATHLNVEVRTLEVWIERQWLVPAQVLSAQTETEPTFSETDVARGRLIQDLRESFGVNDQGIDVVLHLLDQLHGVRRAFEDLHAEMKNGRI